MNWGYVQRPVLLVPHVSRQRWVLIAIAVIAPAAASLFTAIVAGYQIGVVFALVLGFAFGSAMFPGSHTATAAEAIVASQWLLTTRDSTSAWAIPTALCLFVFHLVIALMALTPITATIDRSILVRWLRRSGGVVVATVAMWALVYGMAERRASGSGALTAFGFVTLTGLILAIRFLSVPPDDES